MHIHNTPGNQHCPRAGKDQISQDGLVRISCTMASPTPSLEAGRSQRPGWARAAIGGEHKSLGWPEFARPSLPPLQQQAGKPPFWGLWTPDLA